MRTFVFLCAFICLCISAEADVKFTDVTDESGIGFQHFTGATFVSKTLRLIHQNDSQPVLNLKYSPHCPH